jgi:hypothetical protein
MSEIKTIDPLGDVTLLWLKQHSQSLCTCAAKNDDKVRHAETCDMSPIYAGLFRICEKIHQDPHSILMDINRANRNITQHVINCAQCSKTIMAKDADVIYKAVLAPRGRTDLRYPANIVKAVCPEHNRKGTVSFQGVAPNGY